MRRAALFVVLLTLVAKAPADDELPFQKELLAVGKAYGGYGMVDDEARWAPALCRMPNPAKARLSEAEEQTPHARKVYFLFAKERAAYVGLAADGSSPMGQVIVKEAWTPKELTGTPLNPERVKEGVRDRTVRAGDKVFHASERAGLFVMLKLDPKTEGTDRGWVYGTLDAAGTKVTAAGKIASCMKCHGKATRDRLFGMN